MAVVASFSFTNNECLSGNAVLVGGTVGFIDGSTGGVTSWAWNFGDPGSGANNTSTLQNPSHTYNGAIGTYNTTLTVTGPGGPSSFLQSIGVITVRSFFNISAGPYHVGTPITLTDASTGPVATYIWSAAGGVSFSPSTTVQNPTATFSSAGVRSVSLFVADSTGGPNHSNSGTRAFTVLGPLCVAAFTHTPDPQAPGLNVTFTDTSTGSPTSWFWDFGDGHTSTSQNPTHAYSASGTYTVQLTATNATNSDTIPHNINIVSTLAITPITLPNLCNHSVYPTQTLTASGNIPPYTWSSVGSTLNSGLSFNTSNQQFSGTPTASGIGNLHITLTDTVGGIVIQDFPFTIYPTQTITTTDPMPDAVTGTSYSETLATAATSGSSGDGGGPATWAITAGALPDGLSLNTSTGEISGLITAVAGNYSFTVQATNIFGCVDE